MSADKMLKTKPKYEELEWSCLVCGRESARRFKRQLATSSGWTSTEKATFPLDIILAFPEIVNVWKIVISCNDENVPRKIDVKVGQKSDNSFYANSEIAFHPDPTYEDAKNAKYIKFASITFEKRNKRTASYEARNYFLDAIGQFLWLIVHGSYDKNGIVRFSDITVWGYKNIDIGSKVEESDKKKMEDKNTETNLPESKNGEPKILEDEPEQSIVFIDNGDYQKPSMAYSTTGDGMNTSVGTGALSGDPLTSVRTVRRILEQKRRHAVEEDQIVLALTCRRASERLVEYEARIIELKTKMSQALANDDFEYAERYRLGMEDCRNTVFRVIQLDLLLDIDDLAALGTTSTWASKKKSPK